MNVRVFFAVVSPGLLLKSTEEDVLTQLMEEMKLYSESLISDLNRAIVELKSEPIHFYQFTKYASMVFNLH